MNFLELCRRTREKCGISGNGPITTTNQSGENLRIVNWVQEAWEELQNMQPDWFWMRSSFTLSLTTGVQTYAPSAALNAQGGPLTDLLKWRDDTLRCYRPSLGVSDEQYLRPFLDYDSFRDTYQYGTRTVGRPSFFAIRPTDLALCFGPTPQFDLTVVGDYQRRATLFTADNSLPTLPVNFHMLIVYGAMERYASYEAAPEVLAGMQRDRGQMMTDLMTNQLQTVSAGDALA